MGSAKGLNPPDGRSVPLLYRSCKIVTIHTSLRDGGGGAIRRIERRGGCSLVVFNEIPVEADRF